MSPRGVRWLGLAGGLMVAIGAGFTVARVVELVTTEPAVGTIAARGETGYTVSVETDAGVVHFSRTLPVDKDERDRLVEGAHVPVRYLPGRELDAHVVSGSFWYAPLGFLLVGALGLAAAAYARRSARPGA